MTPHRRLKDNATGGVFCAATYHMPCAFRSPAVMAVHMALCGQRAFSLAGTDPFVLCGDFNVQPVRCALRLFPLLAAADRRCGPASAESGAQAQ